MLTLSYVYIYVRNPKTIATPVRIYTYTDFAIEIWAFNRRLTDTLQYHEHEAPTCFLLLAAITSACLPVGRKVNCTQSSSLFFATFESYDCRTKFKFIDWQEKQLQIVWIFCRESEVSGWFDLKPVHSQLNPSAEAMTRPIWHMCEFLFWTICSLNFCTFVDPFL